MYLGETGQKFVCRLSDHKCGEGNRTTNLLYARYFIEENHKFVNPLEDYEILKVVNNTVERKLREELEILKEREKGLDLSLIHISSMKCLAYIELVVLLPSPRLWSDNLHTNFRPVSRCV